VSDNTIVISQITDVDDELNLKHFIVSSYEDFCFQHKNHYQFLLETGVFFNSNFPNPENIRARYWVYKNISDAESVDIEDLWHENKNSLLFAYEQLFDVSNLEKYPGFEPGDPFPLEDFYEIMDKKVIQSWRLDKHLQIDEEFEGLSYPEEVFSLLVKIYIEKANDSPQRVTSMSDITFVYDNGTYSGDELNGGRHGFEFITILMVIFMKENGKIIFKMVRVFINMVLNLIGQVTNIMEHLKMTYFLEMELIRGKMELNI